MIIKPTQIRCTIDKLVLRGFAPEDRKPLLEALKAELARTLTDPTARAEYLQSSQIPVRKVSQLDFAPGPAGTRTLGRSIATTIVQSTGARRKP